MSDDSIRVVQIILEGSGQAAGTCLLDAVDDVVTHERYRTRRSAKGTFFPSFVEFARAPRPHGWDVNSESPLRLLRFALLQKRHHGALADLLDICAREQGRPPETLAKGELNRFYTVPTSYNTIDRILVTLKRKHEPLLEEVRKKTLKPREAALRAGFLAQGATKLRAGACDLEKARALPNKVQGDLLCEIFTTLCLDAQCALISRCIEPVLGPGPARRWREKRGSPDHE